MAELEHVCSSTPWSLLCWAIWFWGRISSAQWSSLCSKMGYKIMLSPCPKSLLSASPRQHFFWSLVFYGPTGSPQSNPLIAGPEVLHFYACQLHEWIKVSREDNIRETLGHSQEQRCKLKERMGLEDPSDSVIWRDGMCSFSALNHIGWATVRYEVYLCHLSFEATTMKSHLKGY